LGHGQVFALIPGVYIKIETDKFPVLPGEDSEVVNEGMYGKALCQYLENELPKYGVVVNFFCSEDWGWWVDITENDHRFGLLVHSHKIIGSSPEIYVIGSSITSRKKWFWKRFKSLDVSNDVISDSEIWSVERSNEFSL